MSKFKVGEQYKIPCDAPLSRRGNVLEITDIEGDKYYYKVISGRTDLPNLGYFMEGSNTYKYLKPIYDRYELHITCFDGKTTNAVYKVNGKVVERGKAICAPSDVFDFVTGARLAMNRALGVIQVTETATEPTQPEPQEDKPKYEYKVGDLAKVVGNTCNHCFEKGEIVKIIRLDADYGGRAKSLSRNETWEFHPCDIEPYTEPEQFDWDAFKAGKIAVHCDTEEKAKAFLKECDKHGCRRGMYDSISIIEYWDGPTIYSVHQNNIGTCSDSWHTEHGYTIVDCPVAIEPEQPKYYSGKVVCVDAGSLSNITVGKVYSVKDGKITHDDGNVSPWFTSGYESVEDLNDKASRYSKAKFIEYKGEAQ